MSYVINFEAVPEELKTLPQWVCWKAVVRPNGKITKVPMNPLTGIKASSINSKTWASFDKAATGMNRHGYDGIGFVFVRGDGLVGVDLDNCMRSHGQLETWAQDIVDRLDSYTEVSPSGNGVHIICYSGASGLSYNKDGREMYSEGRYFTVTGNEYYVRGHSNEN
ncbi:hypothetical protein GP2143_03203 [marine gamma proteobacterium HTCC2143]|uniref:DNA primase/polymerase bifunctional N-terminal domain-containing protein n=1 Tax=marine gamma proteobacterium HTCC2143 TaxID=247633 RepID=A0YCZ2_9GAMM|nr:hypothetical protein GP2143_03203 [marine gamma proteobacterium HTCC2143]